MKTVALSTRSRFWRALVSSVCVAALLAGCASTPPDMASINPATPKKVEALNFLQEEPVITLETEPNEFWTIEYDRGDKLPSALVGPISANDVSVSALIEMIAKSLNIGIIKDEEIASRRLSYSDPKRRQLSEVLDTITRKTGLFYEYRDGMISFDTKRRFFVRVPRIELIESIEESGSRANRNRDRDRNRTRSSSRSRTSDREDFQGDLSRETDRVSLTESSLVTIANAFENLGAEDVFVDVITGTVTFTADYRTYRMAQKFMQSFETGRDMLIYDVWVFERTLRKGDAAGLYWDKLAGTINGATVGAINEGVKVGSDRLRIGPAGNPGGFQFGIITNPSGLILNLLASLLDEDSQSEIVARPTITLMSGGMSQFHVGETREYIAEVRGTTTGAVTASTSETVETDTLETGIILKIKGAHSDGLINTLVDLNMVDLIEFREFSTGGNSSGAKDEDERNVSVKDSDGNPVASATITPTTTNAATPSQRGVTLLLPHTSNRTIKTVFDARPGDLIVLGGLIRSKADLRNRNLYKTGITLGKTDDAEKVETIMLMRPRLVKIRPKGTVVPVRNEVNVPPGVSTGSPESGPLILRGDPKGTRQFPVKPDASIFGLDPNSVVPRPHVTPPASKQNAVSPAPAPGAEASESAQPAAPAAPGEKESE